MACGIIVSERLNLSLHLLTVVLAFLVLTTISALVLRNRSESIKFVLPSLLVLCVVGAGAWKFALDRDSVITSALLVHADAGREIRAVGTVVDPPQKKPKTFQLVMRVVEIDAEDRIEAANDDLLLYVPRGEGHDSAMKDLRAGAKILVYGKVQRPSGPRNPGDFDFRHYLFLNGISAVMYAKSAEDLLVVSRQPYGWSLRGLVSGVRSRIMSVIDETVGGVEGAFLKGLLLGDRSDIPTELKTSFVNAGVIHILAVSGSNVGMVALIFLSVFKLLRVQKTLTTLLTIASLLFYMLLTGSASSVVRATIMAIILLLAPVLQRKSDVFNTLAFSALLIFFFDAKQLFDPGFQLSYAAVASILYFYPKIASLSNYLPEKVRARRLVDFTWKLFSVTFAAQVGTIPFTAAYFGKVSIISLVANLFVIPAVAAGLAIGLAISFFSMFSAWLAAIYGTAGQLLLELVLKMIDFSGSLSFAYVSVPSFGLLAFLIYYVTVAVLFNLRGKEIRNTMVFALLILGNIALLPGILSDNPKVRLTVIDVGQGDASLVQFPSGKALLIDAGPKTFTYDAGERIVVPFLKRTVRRLDGLLVTHPHSDHLGGVESVLRSIPVDMVLDAGQEGQSSIYRGYRRALRELGIPRVRLRAGDTINLFDEARVFVLHPTSRFVQRDSLHFVRNFNNGSVVLKIVYGKAGLLLVGDAEDPSETQMLLVYDGFLKSDFIKVGHHGSITSSGEEFIEAVKPQYAAISVGAVNKFGHPSTEVIGRYKALGTTVSRTDQQGALMYETDGETVKTVEWR
jgi:competence protein ComEC